MVVNNHFITQLQASIPRRFKISSTTASGFRLSIGFDAFSLCPLSHHLKPGDILPADMAQLDSPPRGPCEGRGIYHDGKPAVLNT
jgi:hypothetical protein